MLRSRAARKAAHFALANFFPDPETNVRLANTVFGEKKSGFFKKDVASEDQDELTDKALAALKLKAMGNRFIFIIKL